MNALSEWQNFYVIVGSAAAGLTGLQFVTMALIAELPMRPEDVESANASFSTPTIVWFCTALMMAATLVAPWPRVAEPAMLLAALGIAELIYSVFIGVRMRSQRAYKPVLQDWVYRLILPVAAQAVLVASAWATRSSLRKPLFGFATAALLFLFIGIQNAWDNVTYLVAMRRHSARDESK